MGSVLAEKSRYPRPIQPPITHENVLLTTTEMPSQSRFQNVGTIIRSFVGFWRMRFDLGYSVNTHTAFIDPLTGSLFVQRSQTRTASEPVTMTAHILSKREVVRRLGVSYRRSQTG